MPRLSFYRKRWDVFLVENNSRRVSIAVAIGKSVRVPGIRVIAVVICTQVVPNLVYVRKVQQTVGVHNGVAVLGESRCRGLHGEPVAGEKNVKGRRERASGSGTRPSQKIICVDSAAIRSTGWLVVVMGAGGGGGSMGLHVCLYGET